MARVSSTASLGIKVSLEHKKAHGKYDSIAPHYSFTIERTVDDSLGDDQLAEKAMELNKICEQMVKEKINQEVKEIRSKE